MPLTTVTIVVEPIFPVPVGETELDKEVDSKSGVVEVEGVGLLFERVEVEVGVGVVRMGVGEDDVNINANDVGVVIVGVGVDGSSSVVEGTGNVIVLV